LVSVTDNTWINKIEELKITISPNPASNSVDIFSAQPFTKIRVWDSQGKFIDDFQFNEKTYVNLPLNGTSGVYSIEISYCNN